MDQSNPGWSRLPPEIQILIYKHYSYMAAPHANNIRLPNHSICSDYEHEVLVLHRQHLLSLIHQRSGLDFSLAIPSTFHSLRHLEISLPMSATNISTTNTKTVQSLLHSLLRQTTTHLTELTIHIPTPFPPYQPLAIKRLQRHFIYNISQEIGSYFSTFSFNQDLTVEGKGKASKREGGIRKVVLFFKKNHLHCTIYC
jgi:hypothetical protein